MPKCCLKPVGKKTKNWVTMKKMAPKCDATRGAPEHQQRAAPLHQGCYLHLEFHQLGHRLGVHPMRHFLLVVLHATRKHADMQDKKKSPSPRSEMKTVQPNTRGLGKSRSFLSDIVLAASSRSPSKEDSAVARAGLAGRGLGGPARPEALPSGTAGPPQSRRAPRGRRGSNG